MTGAEVLEVLVRLETSAFSDPDLGTWSAWIAKELTGRSDGRAVKWPIRRLEREGLIERMPGRGTEPYFRSTERGREVDAILARITAARGGTFVPRSHAGISSTEDIALR